MSAGLDELLRHPALWRARNGAAPAATIPTGFPELDARLPGGGWPASGVIELLVDRPGSCELSLVMPSLAALQRRHPEAWLMLVQPPYEPYAPALAAQGIDLNRLLIVHDAASLRMASLWSLEQALRSASCCCVVGWVMQPLRLRMTELRRLQLAATEAGALCLLCRPLAAAAIPSAAGLRVALKMRPGRLGIHLLKCRGGQTAELELPYPEY